MIHPCSMRSKAPTVTIVCSSAPTAFRFPPFKTSMTWPVGPINIPSANCSFLVRTWPTNIANAWTERSSAAKVRRAGRTLLIVLGCIGALGGLLCGYAIARWISRTVARLSVRVQAVHAHLDQEVGAMTVESSQDLGEINRQLDRVIGRVREVCEKLQQQERDILRSEQLAAVGQLAAGVAHEIRNPLTGIKILIEAALRPHSGAPLIEEELRMMLNEIGRVERTVQGLLNVAKTPLGDRRLEDLRELIDQEVVLIHTRADRLQVQLITHKPDLPVEATVNRDQFLAVLTNLMLNALDATSAGGQVEITLSPPTQGRITLSIADTGTGISKAIADRLFQPFATTKPTGTGLGLSVSHNIIREHGGTLTAPIFRRAVPALPFHCHYPRRPGMKLLVVDDEPMICYSFKKVFGRADVQVLTAGSLAEAREHLTVDAPDVVVLDLQLPDGSGLTFFEQILALDPKRPVIFITAHGTTDTAIEAMKKGAFDYLIKPIDLEKMTVLLERAFDAVHRMRIPTELPDDPGSDRIVGRSPIMQEMCKKIGRVAAQDVNILILGESGTGKELIARAIYHHSRRANKPFLAINCAALPENLIESELFGHEQGAFTGAVKQRIGKFEQCDGGTILLDEIGDMPLAAQGKILRLLQDQQFERIGGNKILSTHVRILAATNQNLEQRIAEGKFRNDLFYRLKVVTVHVPAVQSARRIYLNWRIISSILMPAN